MPHRVLLGRIESAATEILTLAGEMDEHDFFDTRLTRAETVKRLLRIAEAAERLPAALREAIPEIDWARWRDLAGEPAAAQATLWAAIRELTPTTLQWLRVYRDARPELFIPAS